MSDALSSVKLFAVATGLVLGLCTGAELASASYTPSLPVLSASEPVTPTSMPIPASAPAGSSVFVTVHGIACIDRDNSGVCAGDEARVPNVIVRNTDGIAVISDNSGEFTIQAAPRSDLDIAIPVGYKSINGNLHRYHIQMADAHNIDIALAIDTNYTQNATQSGGSTGAANTDAVQVPGDTVPLTGNNGMLWAALAGIVILVTLAVLLILRIIQTVFQRFLYQHNAVQLEQYTKDVAARLESADGWQIVAGQITADILHKTVTIDTAAGILNAISEPSPRFSIVTLDRQEIMFTTNPGFVRKARLIRGGDRIIDVTGRSALGHISIRMLWRYICETRGMLQSMPADSTHWFMVVRLADNRPVRKRQSVKLMRTIIPRARAQPYQPWRGQA